MNRFLPANLPWLGTIVLALALLVLLPFALVRGSSEESEHACTYAACASL